MWNKVTETKPAKGKKVIVLCDTGRVSDAIRNPKFRGGFEERLKGYSFSIGGLKGNVIGWLPYSKNVK